MSRRAPRPARRSRSSSGRSTSSARARPTRLAELQAAGVDERAPLRRDPDDGVGGFGAFFLLLDEPEVYGLPPDPVATDRDLGRDVAQRRAGGARCSRRRGSRAIGARR